MPSNRLFGVLLVAESILAATDIHAQVPRSGGGGGEAQKFMQQYQELAAERTSMQAQIADLKKQLDSSTTELAKVKKERDALKQGAGISAGLVSQANASKASAEQALEQSKQRMNDLVVRFRESLVNLREVEEDRTKLQQQLTDRTKGYATCVEDNLKLYDISSDVLTRYQRVGVFTRVSAAEPFTKLTRTRLENLATEYRLKADELKVKKP
jgi:chromosome segregation ATPase